MVEAPETRREHLRMHFLRLMLLLAIATLAGCGGSGGGGGSSGSASPPPRDGLQLDPTSANPGTAQGWAAMPGWVNVAWQDNAYITTWQTGPLFSHTFTAVDAFKGRITIQPAYATDAGIFPGTITVNACFDDNRSTCRHVPGSPKTIAVNYYVGGLSVTPAQLTFSSTGANPQTQTATLAVVNMLADSYTWQVSYSPSATQWLQVRPNSGTPDLSRGPQALIFSVNAVGLSAGVYSATVTFSTAAGLSVPMTVTLLVGDASVNFVAPYVVPATTSGNVIIRGRGFSALSADSLSVQFNSTSAVSAVVVSDTEIRATPPQLAAGPYSISVSSGAASIPTRAVLKLVVVDPPAFPFTSITRPTAAGRPANLIYDAERRALLFTDPANNRILRYALSDSGSTALDSSSAVGHIALSPDGTELIRVVPGMPQLLRLDPVTLATLSSVDAFRAPGSSSVSTLAFANDGAGIGGGVYGYSATLYRYDMLTQTFSPISSFHTPLERQVFASADGSTLVLPYTDPHAGDNRIYTYDATTGRLTPRPVTTPGFRALSVSRNGSRIILADMGNMSPQTVVYGAEFNALGTLPNDAIPFVLSPNGDFAYAYHQPEGRVRKFSISAGGVIEVGSSSAVAPANTEMSEMTISPDGGTLFLVGTTSVVIAPAP
jgi:hypothetical protein